MKTSPRMWLMIFILGAALLAFIFRPVLESVVIGPLVYAFRVIGLVVRSFSQNTCWLALVGGLAALAFSSAFGIFSRIRGRERFTTPSHGPVEEMAVSVRGARGGRYFKWILANRLGRLAREHLRPRSEALEKSSTRLVGAGWDPPREIQDYLEAGLAQAPLRDSRSNLLGFTEPSPLDLDPQKVIAFLEEQMEIDTREHNDSEPND